MLRVTPTGHKTWAVTWARGQERVVGTYPAMSLEMARDSAKRQLAEISEHGAPLAVIEASKPVEEKPLTLDAFLARHYEPWAITNQKAGKATVANLRAVHVELLPKLLTDLSAFDFERHKSARIKDGVKPATVNRDLSRVRGALSRAVEWGFLREHPLKRVKALKGDDDGRVRYLSAQEEKRLRAALDAREAARRASRESGTAWCKQRGGDGRPMWPADGFTDHLMPMVLVAFNTGLRRGELLSLAWDNVSLSRKALTVVAATAKSGKTRHVPLNAEAHDVLTRWKKQGAGKGLVFAGLDGERMATITTSWRKLVADAELVDFRFHDLRHTFASRMVMAGVDLYAVMRLLGHADFEMTAKYAHLAPDHLAAAVATVGAR